MPLAVMNMCISGKFTKAEATKTRMRSVSRRAKVGGKFRDAYDMFGKHAALSLLCREIKPGCQCDTEASVSPNSFPSERKMVTIKTQSMQPFDAFYNF